MKTGGNPRIKGFKNGCRLWHDCFTCLYDDCIEGSTSSVLRKQRDKEIIKRFESGASIKEIMQALEISERTTRKVIRGKPLVNLLVSLENDYSASQEGLHSG